ncbi:tRNA1Val (adenine37-N6)-methyltransferase [Mucilaginibacter gracilis]|uniref:tRNA1(Val) (adenine(37)-N6)-methyltransferase n=1 Tax=Mucilaginibacter gracilis TaxID=423350 RepID=A0A495J0A2_9SPHI|nr:methyltransferase [Mucilaginibacter gracilis]RKR82357.1 tRNA1Val (adenine37-N6)-methyltransferase [Mucilaginibacter gracilis]
MLFKFKQFEVEQSGCAMKINTDGVLLGCLAGTGQPQTILDIGTGTGVIAMMMAQRFPDAIIDAVEIDTSAAQTAQKNFKGSVFANRLNVYPVGFEEYFTTYPQSKYNVIVSNPPFYINSLEAAATKTNLAKHTDGFFFETLIKVVSTHLTSNGLCWLVLPISTAVLVKQLCLQNGLFVQQVIAIQSFAHSEPHRQIIAFGLTETEIVQQQFVIYDAPKVYSGQYQQCLRDFFTIF